MMRAVVCLLSLLAFCASARAGDYEHEAHKQAEEAPKVLHDAKLFTIGPVGESGTPSGMESSFRALLKRPDAVAECKKLVAGASAAGKLYGLLGLHLLDGKAFEESLPQFKDSKTTVVTMKGCQGYPVETGQIAEGIRSGRIK